MTVQPTPLTLANYVKKNKESFSFHVLHQIVYNLNYEREKSFYLFAVKAAKSNVGNPYRYLFWVWSSYLLIEGKSVIWLFQRSWLFAHRR